VNEIHESTGSYALDALDEAELAEFEAHLAACGNCSQEVAEFHETAAELTRFTETAPPLALRDTVLCAVRKTPQLPAQHAADRDGHATDAEHRAANQTATSGARLAGPPPA
jgi:anti-sigma factor RsiW